MRKVLMMFLVAMLSWQSVALAQEAGSKDAETKAAAAVAGILFDADADEFTSYRINEKGFVDITFARNTPDSIYSSLLQKLNNHPDIDGVLAGRGGPVCGRF